MQVHLKSLLRLLQGKSPLRKFHVVSARNLNGLMTRVNPSAMFSCGNSTSMNKAEQALIIEDLWQAEVGSLLCELAHALMNHERDISEADLQEIVLAALPEDAQPFSKVLSQALVFFFLSFPNLVVGLLDFKVYVVHVLRPEPDCSAQRQGLPAPPNPRVSPQRPTTKHPCSAQPRPSILQETLHFLCTNGFRVRMLEVNVLFLSSVSAGGLDFCDFWSQLCLEAFAVVCFVWVCWACAIALSERSTYRLRVRGLSSWPQNFGFAGTCLKWQGLDLRSGLKVLVGEAWTKARPEVRI